MRRRSPTGALGSIKPLSTAEDSFDQDLAVSPEGDAVVVWDDATDHAIQGRRLAASGNLGRIVNLSAVGTVKQTPTVTVASGGDAVAAWENLGTGKIEARGFRENGTLDPLANPAGNDTLVSDPHFGGDGRGNTALVWMDVNGKQIDGAIFDGGGPELRSLRAPTTVERTAPAAFSFSPADLLSHVASSRWEFGDGSGATGASVSHTYTRAGTFTARAISTDTVGNTRTVSRTVRVVDTRKPSISHLRLSRTRFRARRKAGTRIGFRISEPASVSFTVQRRKVSRRGGRVRFVKAGSFKRTATAGHHTIKFTGKLGRKVLRTGRYRLVVVATDPSGNRSGKHTRRFRIVRR
jgi:hypothetical protein